MMKRTHIIALVVLAAAIPATAAGSFFKSDAQRCFSAGSAGYLIADHGSANYTVRIDNAAPHPKLRMQLVNDPLRADFVLIDDSGEAGACAGVSTIKSIRVDPAARQPDMTVALSREPADYKIYVRSATFSQQDAAALFAVIWQDANRSPRLASRD
jgi:hypothetical protein